MCDSLTSLLHCVHIATAKASAAGSWPNTAACGVGQPQKSEHAMRSAVAAFFATRRGRVKDASVQLPHAPSPQSDPSCACRRISAAGSSLVAPSLARSIGTTLRTCTAAWAVWRLTRTRSLCGEYRIARARKGRGGGGGASHGARTDSRVERRAHRRPRMAFFVFKQRRRQDGRDGPRGHRQWPPSVCIQATHDLWNRPCASPQSCQHWG